MARASRCWSAPRPAKRPLRNRMPETRRGAALKTHCEAKLKEAQLRVEKILVGPGGPEGLEPANFS